MQKKILLAITIGFGLGVIWLAALRFAGYENPNVHYHANFALYINGEQDKFDNFTFYEEVQSCDSDEVNNPKTRVHLHDRIAHVAHVHDTGSTWGHLFANLAYTLGDDLIKNDDGVYVDGAGKKKLTFWLNGKPVAGAANRPIMSEDVLLIDYGSTSQADLQKRYDAISKDAADYNQRTDPSACSGAQPASWTDRLKDSFGLW